VVVEKSPGEWWDLGQWLLTGIITGGSSAWYFESAGSGERVPLVGRADLTGAHRCPRCGTIVITPDDATREEMAARWQRLTGESPRSGPGS
jgi:hypothetical protein